MDIEIKEVKDVWVAWSNYDLTEGRGGQFPLVVCETEQTAIRLGKGKYVMGTDCPVTKETCIKVNNQWLALAKIVKPSKEDVALEKVVSERERVIEKAKELGLTDSELAILEKR